MKNYTKDELKKIYAARREKLFAFMKENKITAAVFEDTEGRRDLSVRYFTGHPSDALWICSSDGKNTLVPWDENLAKERSVDVKIVPYNKYDRKNIEAVREILKSFKKNDPRLKVEVSPATPYPLFLKYVDALQGWDVLCRENSVHDFVLSLRACKDEYEIECTKEAARVGDLIIEKIENGIDDGSIKTEMDVSLLIERELRLNGCERNGFDTLAAGSSRSFAIHAFPGYTSAPWPGKGLSILDFGVVFEGYTSDTTLTVVKDATDEQKKLVELVEKAAKEALPYYKNGEKIKMAGLVADEVFKKAKREMPHTLGHGIGLEIHEFPRVSAKQTDDLVFKPGMIVTLEPGLYDSKLGGVRLENDVLVTENGNEVITHSKIIYR
ncbi:MAG: Xaa-Pro peptidase family protein [Spirochaetales bacterium]|uniref:M24 family metallopeptidase n=1 Tax=Treponema berlinense TaxID=225004 RepID=UPI0023525CD9|nr:Xaa-Pro peptidase family protein [Treponema berlinense]MCI5541855.1 Xaa-Pro peptidase family protein [Treponema berlinense]MDO5767120.1 Xaa-Pro peptidase family protein [Spirochaetales bacterium]